MHPINPEALRANSGGAKIYFKFVGNFTGHEITLLASWILFARYKVYLIPGSIAEITPQGRCLIRGFYYRVWCWGRSRFRKMFTRNRHFAMAYNLTRIKKLRSDVPLYVRGRILRFQRPKVAMYTYVLGGYRAAFVHMAEVLEFAWSLYLRKVGRVLPLVFFKLQKYVRNFRKKIVGNVSFLNRRWNRRMVRVSRPSIGQEIFFSRILNGGGKLTRNRRKGKLLKKRGSNFNSPRIRGVSMKSKRKKKKFKLLRMLLQRPQLFTDPRLIRKRRVWTSPRFFFGSPKWVSRRSRRRPRRKIAGAFSDLLKVFAHRFRRTFIFRCERELSQKLGFSCRLNIQNAFRRIWNNSTAPSLIFKKFFLTSNKNKKMRPRKLKKINLKRTRVYRPRKYLLVAKKWKWSAKARWLRRFRRKRRKPFTNSATTTGSNAFKNSNHVKLKKKKNRIRHTFIMRTKKSKVQWTRRLIVRGLRKRQKTRVLKNRELYAKYVPNISNVLSPTCLKRDPLFNRRDYTVKQQSYVRRPPRRRSKKMITLLKNRVTNLWFPTQKEFISKKINLFSKWNYSKKKNKWVQIQPLRKFQILKMRRLIINRKLQKKKKWISFRKIKEKRFLNRVERKLRRMYRVSPRNTIWAFTFRKKSREKPIHLKFKRQLTSPFQKKSMGKPIHLKFKKQLTSTFRKKSREKLIHLKFRKQLPFSSQKITFASKKMNKSANILFLKWVFTNGPQRQVIRDRQRSRGRMTKMELRKRKAKIRQMLWCRQIVILRGLHYWKTHSVATHMKMMDIIRCATRRADRRDAEIAWKRRVALAAAARKSKRAPIDSPDWGDFGIPLAKSGSAEKSSTIGDTWQMKELWKRLMSEEFIRNHLFKFASDTEKQALDIPHVRKILSNLNFNVTSSTQSQKISSKQTNFAWKSKNPRKSLPFLDNLVSQRFLRSRHLGDTRRPKFFKNLYRFLWRHCLGNVEAKKIYWKIKTQFKLLRIHWHRIRLLHFLVGILNRSRAMAFVKFRPFFKTYRISQNILHNKNIVPNHLFLGHELGWHTIGPLVDRSRSVHYRKYLKKIGRLKKIRNLQKNSKISLKLKTQKFVRKFISNVSLRAAMGRSKFIPPRHKIYKKLIKRGSQKVKTKRKSGLKSFKKRTLKKKMRLKKKVRQQNVRKERALKRWRLLKKILKKISIANKRFKYPRVSRFRYQKIRRKYLRQKRWASPRRLLYKKMKSKRQRISSFNRWRRQIPRVKFVNFQKNKRTPKDLNPNNLGSGKLRHRQQIQFQSERRQIRFKRRVQKLQPSRGNFTPAARLKIFSKLKFAAQAQQLFYFHYLKINNTLIPNPVIVIPEGQLLNLNAAENKFINAMKFINMPKFIHNNRFIKTRKFIEKFQKICEFVYLNEPKITHKINNTNQIFNTNKVINLNKLKIQGKIKIQAKHRLKYKYKIGTKSVVKNKHTSKNKFIARNKPTLENKLSTRHSNFLMRKKYSNIYKYLNLIEFKKMGVWTQSVLIKKLLRQQQIFLQKKIQQSRLKQIAKFSLRYFFKYKSWSSLERKFRKLRLKVHKGRKGFDLGLWLYRSLKFFGGRWNFNFNFLRWNIFYPGRKSFNQFSKIQLKILLYFLNRKNKINMVKNHKLSNLLRNFRCKSNWQKYSEFSPEIRRKFRRRRRRRTFFKKKVRTSISQGLRRYRRAALLQKKKTCGSNT